MLLDWMRGRTKLTLGQLERYASTASRRYKFFRIDKRGGKEKRPIHQPSREIKALQRWIVTALIRDLPVHAAATAYKKGASIRANAERHRTTRYTIRLDFEDFFPSFHGGHVEAYLQAAAPGLTDADRSFVRRIVCRNDALTIGAPSSPALTNAMMHGFDHDLAAWCAERALIYTRYADDLFISAHEANALGEVEAAVARLAAGFPHANLRLNRGKTAHLSRKYRRSVTGLILTPDGNVSIGRQRKRKLKSDIHRFKTEAPDFEAIDRSRIAGMIAFAKDVEPDFHERLKQKYGAETLEAILKGPYIRATAETADEFSGL